MAKSKTNEPDDAAETVDTVTDHATSNKGTPKQRATIDALNKQPKVTVMFPRMDGQPPEMVVTINAVRWVIPAGVMTEVPKAVAEIFNERLASEGRMLKQSEQAVRKLTAEGLL